MDKDSLNAVSAHLARNAPNYALAVSTACMLGSYVVTNAAMGRAALILHSYANTTQK